MIKLLLLPFWVTYKLYYFLYFVISFLAAYPVFYYLLSDRKRFPRAFVVMRWFALIWQSFAFVPIRTQGRSNIPDKGSFIICANHTSYMDIPVIYCLFKNYFVFVGKKEIEKWPLFHIFYTSKMNISVDRESPSGSMEALKRMLEEIEKGHPLAIFPEGTIPKTVPELGEFKSGAFAIAIRKQIPILPVTFVTNWKRLQRSGLWKGHAGPGYSEVVIHEPVPTTGLTKKDADRLQEKIRAIINIPLKEHFGCDVS